MRSISRALRLSSSSSSAKRTPSNEMPSPPTWQYWQRAFRDSEKRRMMPTRLSREIVFGRTCRFVNVSGICALAGAAHRRGISNAARNAWRMRHRPSWWEHDPQPCGDDAASGGHATMQEGSSGRALTQPGRAVGRLAVHEAAQCVAVAPAGGEAGTVGKHDDVLTMTPRPQLADAIDV